MDKKEFVEEVTFWVLDNTEKIKKLWHVDVKIVLKGDGERRILEFGDVIIDKKVKKKEAKHVQKRQRKNRKTHKRKPRKETAHN